jgi:hypothetical protein
LTAATWKLIFSWARRNCRKNGRSMNRLKPNHLNPVNRNALLSQFVRREIARLLSDNTEVAMAPLAREFRALPINADISGGLFLRENGEVFCVGWEHRSTTRAVDNVWPFIREFIRLAREHPELEDILLIRPRTAHDCFECGGAGRNPAGLCCGSCHGLGWKPSAPLSFRS